MKDNWKVDKIENICDLLDNMRIPLNSEQRDRIPGNIPYYGANGIQGHIGKYIFDEELILLAEDGGNFEEYSIRPIAYKIKGKSWVNNHAHILRAKKENDQNFVFYSLVNKNIIPYIKGGTRSKLNLSDLKCIEINLPPLQQQKKIAQILTTCDAVIEKSEAAIAKYQAMKQGLMHDLFTRGIDVKTGKLRPKQEEAPQLYKESELGWIPKEWEVKWLGDIGDVKMCKRIFSFQTKNEGDIPFYKIGTFGKIPDAFIAKDLYRDYKRKFSFPTAGSVLISAAGTIGRLVVYNGEDAYFQDSNIVWIENNFNIISNEYLKYIFPFVKFKTEGGTIQRLYNNILKSGVFPCPLNSLEQKSIVNKLSIIDKKLNTEQSALSKYQQLKTGLMQDLLSGKVEVKV